jgi:hypothetical protein
LEMIDEYTVGGKEDEGPVVEGYKRFSLTGWVDSEDLVTEWWQ